ncbi:hypothetical protein SAY87_026846 [Trapa incisa]|uniref:Uncharacterized protein n=1 Tax=Trapa incisa TaxID=236973 RepID=A0AAN7H488_9MYRT|nr:hypothetical protein SAY87_026846 [Trapa incisa]
MKKISLTPFHLSPPEDLRDSITSSSLVPDSQPRPPPDSFLIPISQPMLEDPITKLLQLTDDMGYNFSNNNIQQSSDPATCTDAIMNSRSHDRLLHFSEDLPDSKTLTVDDSGQHLAGSFPATSVSNKGNKATGRKRKKRKKPSRRAPTTVMAQVVNVPTIWRMAQLGWRISNTRTERGAGGWGYHGLAKMINHYSSLVRCIFGRANKHSCISHAQH